MKEISSIGGKPVIYDRMPNLGYGVPFKGPKFKGDKELDATLWNLGNVLDRMEWMQYIRAFLCGGMQVNKGNQNNAHRKGIAWDWDGLILTNDTIITYLHADPKLQRRAEAACYQAGFTTVLGSFYDDAHGDHVHGSLKGKKGYTGRTSQVKWIQSCLNIFLDKRLKIDGKMGPLTKTALQRGLNKDWKLKDLWWELIEKLCNQPEFFN